MRVMEEKSKMNKKKILAVLIAAAALSTSLVSCSDDDNKKKSKKESRKKSEVVAEEETTDEEEETEATTEPEEVEEMKMMSAKDIAKLPVAECKSAELKEIGSFEVGDLRFSGGDFIYTIQGEDEIICHDYMGNKLFDGTVLNVYQMDDSGLFSFSVRDGDMVYQGLMDSEGNEVFPADKGVGLFDNIDDRFFTAYFPEEVTEDEDEAIYYVTSSMFSFMPHDGDTLYKGTVKVFDSKTGKFLEKTAENFDPRYSVEGGIIHYYNEDMDPVFVTEDDKLLELPSGYSVTGEFLTVYEDGNIVAYDHQLNKLFTSPYILSDINGGSDFYRLIDTDNHTEGLMYKNGEMVLKPEHNSISILCDGYLCYQPTDDYKKKGILKIDGTVLTEPIYEYVYYTDIPGYFYAKNPDDTYDILDGEGNVIRNSTSAGLYTGGYITEDGDNYFLVRSTGEFSLKFSYSSTYLDDQLLFNSDEKAVYDLVTGEKLFEGVEKAYRIYGYLYVIKDGKATVYEVN